MRQEFTKVVLSLAMSAVTDYNFEVYVEVDGEIVPFEDSEDELVYHKSKLYLKTEDFEAMTE